MKHIVFEWLCLTMIERTKFGSPLSVMSLTLVPPLCLQWERQDQGGSGRLWSRPGQGLHPQVCPLPAGRRPAFLSGHRGQESHTAQVRAGTHARLCTRICPTCTLPMKLLGITEEKINGHTHRARSSERLPVGFPTIIIIIISGKLLVMSRKFD